MENPHFKARGFWVRVEHPELEDTLTYCGSPIKLSEPVWSIRRRAPLIGEHNGEVYEKELGFSKDRLALLKQAGVI
jgi:crotonobetainyl-CoA:carnitine CoA-transferase CaiB-like acyl-CoA transferase